MVLNIEHYPGKRFRMFSCAPEFSVDLNNSVKEKLKTGEQLTNATALKILKQIKWKSDILSFLTIPIVAISLSAGVLVAGFCIPAFNTALFVAHIFVRVLGGMMLGFSIENSCKGFLPELSQAYSDQSQRAREYIRTLEANQEMQIVLA